MSNKTIEVCTISNSFLIGITIEPTQIIQKIKWSNNNIVLFILLNFINKIWKSIVKYMII